MVSQRVTTYEYPQRLEKYDKISQHENYYQILCNNTALTLSARQTKSDACQAVQTVLSQMSHLIWIYMVCYSAFDFWIGSFLAIMDMYKFIMNMSKFKDGSLVHKLRGERVNFSTCFYKEIKYICIRSTDLSRVYTPAGNPMLIIFLEEQLEKMEDRSTIAVHDVLSEVTWHNFPDSLSYGPGSCMTIFFTASVC